MINLKNLFSILSLVILFSACSSKGGDEKSSSGGGDEKSSSGEGSESSSTSAIPEDWWYKVESLGDDIIKFTASGNVQNVNDRTVLTYKISGDTIKVSRGDDVKAFKFSLTSDELTLTDDSRAQNFRKAKDEDFLIGEWKGSVNGNEIRFRFRKNNECVIINGDVDVEHIFSFKDKKVVINNEPIEYTISEDKKNLTLKASKITDNQELSLVRFGGMR